MASKGRFIVLDERLEVERILSSPSLDFDYRKVFMLSKYYYEEGLSKNQVRNKILEYCEKSGVFNIYFFQDAIDKILKDSSLFHLKKSNQNISITKKEINVIKKLPHKIYRIALYMLFVAKFEKYQVLSKKKINKAKGFKTYFNYNIQTALNSIQKIRGGVNKLTKKEEIEFGKSIFQVGFAKPVFLSEAWEIFVADFESKNVEFIIESEIDFDSQIKYYCLECGEVCNKSKMHDLCEKCYDIKRKEYDRNRKKK